MFNLSINGKFNITSTFYKCTYKIVLYLELLDNAKGIAKKKTEKERKEDRVSLPILELLKPCLNVRKEKEANLPSNYY